MAVLVTVLVLLILQLVGQATPAGVGPPIGNEEANSTYVKCTSARINDFLNIGSTYIPDMMQCVDKMSDLGYDYLVMMNDFYNYKYDSFHHDFDEGAKCNNALCTNNNVKYVISMLLRLRAQMFDMMDLLKYRQTMTKDTKRCVYQVMVKFTNAASETISCPAQ